MPTLGVFLDARILRRILLRRPVFEVVPLYERAAREFGLDLLLFGPHAIARRRRRIRGYALPGFRPVLAPLPPVVHNRTLQYPSSIRDARWLQRQGVHVFNPVVPAGKYAKHLMLDRSEAVRPHLPATAPLSQGLGRLDALMRRSGQAFVKPNTGSRGRGVLRITRAGRPGYVVEGGVRRFVGGRRGLRRYLARLARRGPHILQEGIRLARYRDRPFDLRVHLQRGDGGRWTVPGMGARRAGGRRFVTNLTWGGSAHPVGEVFPAVFPGRDPEEIREQVRRVSLAVGEAMARACPGVADLGLDVGLDADAHPWVLEVNLRELRYTTRDAGEHHVFAQVYRNPVAYAHYLLTAGA